MVRTGRRVQALRDLLEQAGLRRADTSPGRPTGVEHSEGMLDVYRRLGGLQNSPLLRPGGWDLVFEGPLVIELDEELHFNRYRSVTLETSWSQALPWTSDYRRFCRDHETDCLAAGRWGKRWTNPSAARQFGGGAAGDLIGGAPRWKQRALYDAIKDTLSAATLPGVHLARLSIYDVIDGAALGSGLGDETIVSPERVRDLVSRRTSTHALDMGSRAHPARRPRTATR